MEEWQFEKAIEHIKNIEEFINHNLDGKCLSLNSTIEDLLELTKSLKENYIPMLKQINEWQ